MTPNREQRAAIQSTADWTIVAAGPGSGKTATLVERVRARAAAGVDPKRIIVLTFTNAGAHVFVERLKPLVVKFAGTLHGFGIRLIQKHGGLLGYRAGSVSVVTKETQEAMLLATAKKLGYARIPKTELFSNSTLQARACWNDYRFELKRANMIDYDRILDASLALLEMLGYQADELYVDERQDSGEIDALNYELIAPKQFHVGDIDQSIYSFRGARPELFLHLAQQHPESTYVLTRNYRSDIAICDAATRLIAHNTNRILKPVVAVSEERGSVTVVEVENDAAEVFKAYQLVRESGVPFKECAILCRTNALADHFRTMLRGFGVAVKQGRRKMPEDWSRALSAIGLLIDPNNDHHAEQILRSRGAKDAEIEALKLKALRGNCSIAAVTGLGAATTFTTFSTALDWLAFTISEESMELIRQRVAVLPNPEPTLSDLLADLWKHDSWDLREEGDGVTVTTIHQGKGNEWDFVLVPAMEEGILPMRPPGLSKQDAEKWLQHADERQSAAIEEERRLCFVAITRARHQLVLMHAKQRTAFYKTTTQEPSRFLQEINEH